MTTTIAPRTVAPDPTTTSSVPARAGGIAAHVAAGTFVVGFLVYGTVIAAGDYGDLSISPATHVAFLADHQAVLHAWYAAIYLVFGATVVVLALALHDKLRRHAPVLARTATIFGLIWATLMFAVGMSAIVGNAMVVDLAATDTDAAASLWTTVQLLIEGMGGGIELVGGLWLGLVSLAALRARVLPTVLNGIGIAAGVAGVATTTLLATEATTSAFGLASIIWFTWMGQHLIRRARPTVPAGRA
jgi:hypothetical protein